MAALETTNIIGVIGAGTMGAGVAQVAAKAGHTVLLYDSVEGAAHLGIQKNSKGLDKLVLRGRMTADERDVLIDRIKPVDTLEELAPASLVIEAIIENLDIKQSIFQRLEDICGDKVILASNTSSLSITAIGSTLKHPERLLGMHFFNPAPIMKLVEIISGLATDIYIAETVFDTAKAWGKKAVHAKSTPGFIVNRVARPFYAEALRVLQEGGSNPATIDAIIRDCGGFRMGPFELMDMIGHDVNYAVTRSVHSAYYGDQRFTPSLIQKELVDGGYLGKKSGQGFYDHSEGSSKPQADTCEPKNTPKNITLIAPSGYNDSLLEMIQQADVSLTRVDEDEEPVLLTDSAVICQTDGRMATVRAAEENISNLILFDLASDYATTTRVTLSYADQADPVALDEAIGLFQKLGKQVTVIDDIAGMCLMRTVCMLANEGADAVNQQVCSINAVDVAMQGGLNYPTGPLAWADSIGLDKVLDVLDNLSQNYGEDRYRPSPLLIRKAAAGRTFHD